jgi:chemotaxis protein methyltransferase CheR
MLYFSAEQIERTMARFHDSLSDSGWLFVGPTEIDFQIQHRFTSLRYDGAFVLTKASDQQQSLDAAWLESPPQHDAQAAPVPSGRLAWATDLPLVALHSPATPLLDALPPAAEPSAAEPSAASAPAPPPPSPAAAEAGGDPGSDQLQEAQALYQAGRYQQAADLALSCPGCDQAHPLTLAARAYANIGRLSEAQECCKRAIDCDRLNAQNHYLLSIILEQQGDAEGAVRSLKHALFIDHDYLLAYFALGNLLRQCGEQRESERNFANALRLLERRHPHDVLPEAEGMTAGRLAEVIRAMTLRETRDWKQ